MERCERQQINAVRLSAKGRGESCSVQGQNNNGELVGLAQMCYPFLVVGRVSTLGSGLQQSRT